MGSLPFIGLIAAGSLLFYWLNFHGFAAVLAKSCLGFIAIFLGYCHKFVAILIGKLLHQ